MTNIKIEELRPVEVDNQLTDLTEGELNVTGGLLDIAVLSGNDDINILSDDSGNDYYYYGGGRKKGGYDCH